MPTPQERLVALGLELPPAPKVMGAYKPCLVVGSQAWVSGHGPLLPDGSLVRGKVGAGHDADAGKEAARRVGLAILATLVATLGSLDAIDPDDLPDDPAALSYLVVTATVLDRADRQRLLECPDDAARLRAGLALLRRESALAVHLPSVPAGDLAQAPVSPN